MIYPQSELMIIDNSGGLRAKCIKTLKSSRKKGSSMNKMLIVSVKSVRTTKKKVKRGKIYKALLVQTKKENNTNSGLTISFDNNSIILLDAKLNPLGTRLLFPVSKFIKTNNNKKLFSLFSKSF